MSQDQPFILKSSLGGACKLGGMESLGISRVEQTVLARLMESQLWHPPAGCVGGGFREGTMASARLFICEKAVPQLSP